MKPVRAICQYEPPDYVEVEPYPFDRGPEVKVLLRQGTSILDAVHEAGYFDQAHLTRSLTHLIGQTPVEIGRGQTQLSFLYKTEPRL